jgi:hypothetical protein
VAAGSGVYSITSSARGTKELIRPALEGTPKSGGSQRLLVHAATAATVGKFAIDHDRWNGSNAQFFGAHKDTTVRHIAHDDFIGRTR